MVLLKTEKDFTRPVSKQNLLQTVCRTSMYNLKSTGNSWYHTDNFTYINTIPGQLRNLPQINLRRGHSAGVPLSHIERGDLRESLAHRCNHLPDCAKKILPQGYFFLYLIFNALIFKTGTSKMVFDLLILSEPKYKMKGMYGVKVRGNPVAYK